MDEIRVSSMNLVCIVAVVVTIALIFWEIRILGNLAKRGTSCSGVIREKGEVTLRASSVYTIVYAFSPPSFEDIEYSRKQQVTQQAYSKLSMGDIVALRYLPDNPHVVRLWGKSRSPQRLYDNYALIIAIVTFFALNNIIVFNN